MPQPRPRTESSNGPLLPLCVAAVAALAHNGALAQPDPVGDNGASSRFAIGADAAYGPEYAGAGNAALKLRPLWAYQYGRWRISSSGAGAVLGFAAETAGAGATAELVKTDRLRFSVGLRIDHGRQSSDSDDLAGLPDVRRTLRGRMSVSYALAPHWSAGASVSQDLLGRGGGALAAFDLGYRDRLTDRTHWSAGAGISLGDGTYLRSYFGVPTQSARADRPAFEPGASLRDVHLGVGLTTAITPRWIAFGGVGASNLLGDAAASPLTKSRFGWSMNVGLAYRCCM